tara:strand:- start:976 stop:2583 length:1608 start_codon:yes stop_codon:yes gene_type:complete
MSNFVKIQAQQSTISTSQNLMDFEIPQHLQGVDLSKSFINIKCRITENDATILGVTPIYNYALKFNGVGGTTAPCMLPNSSLVRNCHLTSSNVGQLESLRRADLFNAVKHHYKSNLGDSFGEQSSSIGQLPSWNQTAGPAGLRNILIDGGAMSTNEDSAFRVDLKDILGLGGSVLNLNQLGSLRLHVEANLNKFTLLPIPVVTTAGVATSNHNEYFHQTSLGATIPIGSQPTEIQVILRGGANVGGFNSLNDRSNCPFWIGQLINVVVTPTTDALLQQTAIITAMEWVDSTDGLIPTTGVNGQIIKLTLNRSYLNAVSTAAITAIMITPIVAINPILEYLGAEIVLATTIAPPVAKGLMYRTFTTQEDYASATTTFQNIYQLPANAIANLVCFDTTSVSTEFSNSWDKDVSQYQLFVDNIPVTDRPVNINTTNADGRMPDSLHGIMLEKTLSEMGIEFKNYTETQLKPLNNAGTDINDNMITTQPDKTDDIGVLVLPAVLPASNGSKLFQINITKSANTDMNIVLFQMIERVINF